MISFGDNDCPCWSNNEDFFRNYGIDMKGTEVHSVHHYHTWQDDTPTGYAKWVDECSPNAERVYDTSWCRIMK